MLFPTLGGLVSSPIKVVTSGADTEFTAQEANEAFFGGAILGAVGMAFRDQMVVRNKLGSGALEKYKSGKILGVI